MARLVCLTYLLFVFVCRHLKGVVVIVEGFRARCLVRNLGNTWQHIEEHILDRLAAELLTPRLLHVIC